MGRDTAPDVFRTQILRLSLSLLEHRDMERVTSLLILVHMLSLNSVKAGILFE